ncbi:MAG TPA: hypothetical protein VFK06_09635 [Candidatus Angelobacter sp.]|nr:hypothetical protein [Candidatus Angelobacter sp.]
MLVYKYLKRCGIRRDQIRIEPSPPAQGSAENWVRNKFVKEVNVYRTRHAQTKLIVVVDADTGTVQDRLRQLDEALKDSGKQAVVPAEQIARLIPRRNVETWIRCLNGHDVDEETNYKKWDEVSKLIPQASETLYQWTHQSGEPPQHCIDSLRHGVRELKRLTF